MIVSQRAVFASAMQAGYAPQGLFLACRQAFETLLRDPGLDLAAYSAGSAKLYARYLISDPTDPFELVLALWRPGADSPIHDHQGLSGMVGLWRGELVETRYELAREGGAFRILWQGGSRMEPGVANPIYPSGMHQVHRMYNSGTELAASLHLYFGKLRRLNRYLPVADGRLMASPRDLWFDDHEATP